MKAQITTLVYDKKRKKKKGKEVKQSEEVEVVESQASITCTCINTEKLILGRPEISFKTTSSYGFKYFVPVYISSDHHFLTTNIHLHFLYS